ncbi:MAG: hypothetical protein M3Y65_23875 [Pseudomonadota bacterium]|nr:hypothetical protein [Pseudomonadota bacterium]
MRIACIAWGSLLWKTGPLKLASPWMAGGPELPLEFVRDSDDSDELAIVLHEGAPLMPTYFAMLDTAELASARTMLAAREKIDPDHPEWIGSIPAVDGAVVDQRIAQWLALQDIDGVVWTALPAKYANTEGRAPSADEAVALLAALRGTTRERAEEYVRRIPDAIRTAYRIRFEQAFQWTPLDVQA